MPDFMSFNEFLDRTAAAKVEHHRETIKAGLAHPLAAARGLVRAAGAKLIAAIKKIKDDTVEEEFGKMKDHILALYKDVKNVSVENTFMGPGGNLVDCINVEDQATFRAAKKAGAKPPSKKNKPTELADPPSGGSDFGPLTTPFLPPLRRGLVDLFGKPMTCPEGRIPLRRCTIAQLASLGSFENFFQKYPPQPGVSAIKTKKPGTRKSRGKTAAPPPPFAGTPGRTEIHRHAVCEDSAGGPYFGCSTWLNLWDVNPTPGVFNLSQLWLLGTNSAGGRQTIESGWQRSPVWNTNVPVIFVFFTKADYNPRPDLSGYFPNVAGFVQTSSNWLIAEALPGPFSESHGDQIGMQMQWEIDGDGNWCLYVGSGAEAPEMVGYFPAGFFGGSFNTSAQVAQFGGEVCSQPPPTSAVTGPMGSGQTPSGDPANDFRVAAYQKQVSVKRKSTGLLTPAKLNVLGADANYGCSPGMSSKANWSSYLFYGGPNG